jgi:hypothetical protein
MTNKKKKKKYVGSGGICIARELHGDLPHETDMLSRFESIVAGKHNAVMCIYCRSLFLPEVWNEVEMETMSDENVDI